MNVQKLLVLLICIRFGTCDRGSSTFETSENHVMCRLNPNKSDRMGVMYTFAAYGWEVAQRD